MLEKIPVGGWRHAESRIVEVFAGKAKARDVVPNWPKSRSTSKPYQLDLSGLHIFGWPCVLSQTAEETVFGVDYRFMQDWADNQAEERRKAEMMEAYWQIERDGLREMIVLNLWHLLIEVNP